MSKHRYLKHGILVCVIFLGAILTSACSNRSNTSAGITVLTEILLPDTLLETSGLFCDKHNIYTLNDSGNLSEIYALNHTGKLSAQISVEAKNIDWEALASDGKNFYIGDFGNNAGNRKGLRILIHNVDKKQTSQHTFTYANDGDVANINEPQSPQYKAHDQDAEALVLKGDDLIMFSKSWKTGIASVYQIETTSTNQILTPTASIAGLPGIITGADWDEHKQQFIVVGYKVNTFSVRPFISLLDAQYNITRTEYLKGFGQVEGVCTTNGELWFTQEKLPFYPAKLVNIALK